MKNQGAVLAGAFLSGCTTVPAAHGATEIVTGVYRYIDGDRLITGCGGRECMHTLIRDDRLDRDPYRLIGSTLTLEVERLSACGTRSSELACYRSSDGTALRIVRRLAVSPKGRP